MELFGHYSYCMDCRRIELGSSPIMVPCVRCQSVGSYTPPIAIYIPAVRQLYLAASPYAYSMEQRVIDESFEEERDPEPKPASERTLEKMKHVILAEEDLCGICLAEMLDGEPVVETPCCHKHTHEECMEKTLLVIPHCPFCRWESE